MYKMLLIVFLTSTLSGCVSQKFRCCPEYDELDNDEEEYCLPCLVRERKLS